MKSQGKCRVCHKSIYYGDLVILASKDCEYIPNQSSKMFAHTHCFLKFIIKDIQKIKLKTMNDEINNFKRISKILEE